MSAIPYIAFSAEKDYEIDNWDLIQIPAEFFSKQQIAYYRRAPLGWSVCPLGYNCFVGKDSLVRRIVFPGIVFPEVDQKRRIKFLNYNLRFSKLSIEKYIRPHLSRSEEVRSQRNTLYRNLTHDLRAISNEIYNQALVARDWAAKTSTATLIKSLDRVVAVQQMMSVRLDIIDYESGQYAVKAPSTVKVFKKVEKVYRCFERKIRWRNTCTV